MDTSVGVVEIDESTGLDGCKLLLEPCYIPEKNNDKACAVSFITGKKLPTAYDTDSVFDLDLQYHHEAT